MTAAAMPSTQQGIGRRHRVVAIGSGLGGLTATRALKHDLVNIADAVVFLTRITAQCAAHVNTRTSLWLQVIPTTAAVLTTVGVLVTLYGAAVRRRTVTYEENSETATAARHLSCQRLLWRSPRTEKGWC